jgi:hypothetical protein
MQNSAENRCDQRLSNAVELALYLEKDLVSRHGVLLSAEALEKELGYASTSALKKALELERLPVPAFKVPFRRGRFVLATDLAHWLAVQSRRTTAAGPDDCLCGQAVTQPEAQLGEATM